MIFRNIIFAAILVGLVSGLVYGVFQQIQLSPIIYAAEKFEANNVVVEHDHHGHDHNSVTQTTWSPANGVERIIWTLVANVLTGISFALVMLSLMAVHNLKSNKPKVDVLQGMGWGVVGLLAIFVAPALIGLQPEVPGTIAGALEHRQAWWLFVVVASAAGAAVLYYAPLKFKALGLAIVLFPQVAALSLQTKTGFENTDPVDIAALNELNQHFYSMTAIGAALFFIVLGAGAGFAMKKFINLESASVSI